MSTVCSLLDRPWRIFQHVNRGKILLILWCWTHFDPNSFLRHYGRIFSWDRRDQQTSQLTISGAVTVSWGQVRRRSAILPGYGGRLKTVQSWGQRDTSLFDENRTGENGGRLAHLWDDWYHGFLSLSCSKTVSQRLTDMDIEYFAMNIQYLWMDVLGVSNSDPKRPNQSGRMRIQLRNYVNEKSSKKQERCGAKCFIEIRNGLEWRICYFVQA